MESQCGWVELGPPRSPCCGLGAPTRLPKAPSMVLGHPQLLGSILPSLAPSNEALQIPMLHCSPMGIAALCPLPPAHPTHPLQSFTVLFSTVETHFRKHKRGERTVEHVVHWLHCQECQRLPRELWVLSKTSKISPNPAPPCPLTVSSDPHLHGSGTLQGR